MSTITININGDDKVSLASDPINRKEQDTQLISQSDDGGAPKFESESSSSSLTTSQLDIGGPPQWLSDALKNEGKAASGVSVSGGLQGIDDSDAGAAQVSFN